MEDVDNITIQTLRAVGVNLDEDTRSVSQLSADNLVEATAICLEKIHPELTEDDVEPLPRRLPNALSARFNVAHRFSQYVKNDGYKGDLGYQTFLYPNERDTRSLLMFLVEHLPKDSVNTAEEMLSSTAVLGRVVAEAIQKDLTSPWLPWYCRTQSKTQSNVARRLIVADVATEGISGRLAARVPPVYHQASAAKGFSLHRSLLERSADLIAIDQLGGERALQAAAKVTRRAAKELKQSAARAAKEAETKKRTEIVPQIKENKKETENSVQEASVEQENKEVEESRDERRERQSRETDEAREALTEVERRLERLEGKRERLSAKLAAAENSVGELRERCRSLDEEAEAKRTTAAMLPSAAENATKLENLVTEKRSAYEKLENEWMSKSAPVLAELSQLRSETTARHALSQLKEAELEEARTALRECTEDARKRDEQLVGLRQKVAKLEAAPNRAYYTRRILDIVSNIKKQKLEVDRVLAQTRGLQKEINTVSGKLERTFMETDELVFRDAKKDDTVRTAYKLLASLHANCETLVFTEEERGSFLRETREVEEQVEGQRRRTQDGQLETVARDCEEMRSLNENIKKALKSRPKSGVEAH